MPAKISLYFFQNFESHGNVVISKCETNLKLMFGGCSYRQILE
jgi:hypothetical protein